MTRHYIAKRNWSCLHQIPAALLVAGAMPVTAGESRAGTSGSSSGVPALTPASPGAGGGNSMDEIADKLNNPASSLISVPLQSNFDFGGGPNDDGFQYRLNVQPVIPIRINDDWKILSRTILPYIYQEDRIGASSSEDGLGDTTVTLWLSPEKPSSLHWGLGPVIQLPTATDDLLGSEKWGLGPSALLLKQQAGLTVGLLANHIWSVAGDGDREDLSLTSLQPFISYKTKTLTTFGGNLESVYDWNHEEWTVPVNLYVTQLVKFGKTPVSFQIGGRYYLEKPEHGPDWGLRFTVTLVFPE